MRLVSLLLASCLVFHAEAQAQTELLGKLVKGDDQSRTPVDNVGISLDEDDSHDLTRDGGGFTCFLQNFSSQELR